MLRVITNLYAERVATAHAPTYLITRLTNSIGSTPLSLQALAAREDHPHKCMQSVELPSTLVFC